MNPLFQLEWPVYNASMVKLSRFHLDTSGKNEVIDITEQVEELVKGSSIASGIALIFVPGSTGALSTLEYEPGLIRDLPGLLDKLIPQKAVYHHNETWHDGNGHSHLRATLIGPSLTIPVEEGRLVLGTWQQIVFLELDVRPRRREIVVQVMGDPAR